MKIENFFLLQEQTELYIVGFEQSCTYNLDRHHKKSSIDHYHTLMDTRAKSIIATMVIAC